MSNINPCVMLAGTISIQLEKRNKLIFRDGELLAPALRFSKRGIGAPPVAGDLNNRPIWYTTELTAKGIANRNLLKGVSFWYLC